MRDGKCTKKFPKAFAEFTTTGNDSYPIYQRRNNKRTVQVNGVELDNRSVAPYNPYLLFKYNAHINVEICSTVSAVKYLYKYVYKGHDRAIVEFHTGDSSPQSALSLMAPCVIPLRKQPVEEACWRMTRNLMIA